MILIRNKFLKDYSKIYFMRLQRSKRFQYPFYFIVVTNHRDGIINTIGYYNPQKLNYKLSYKEKNQYIRFSFKSVGINYKLLSYWFNKGVIPTPSLMFLLKNTGTLKNFRYKDNNDSDKFFQKNLSQVYNDVIL